MAISFTKSDTSPDETCGHKFTSGQFIDTFVNTRFYMRFDLSGQPFTVDDIVSVKLRIRVINQVGSPDTYELYTGSAGDNWGATLDANAVDFASTRVNLEDTLVISSTGFKTFTPLNKNNLILSGDTHFMIRSTTENAQNFKNITIAAQENGNASWRPRLIIVYNP